MIKVFIGGIAVGLANIIPGVSGGTMMVVLGLFNRVMEAISGVFKIKNPNRLEDIKFLLTLLVGAGLGLVVFAKLLEFLFSDYPTQTLFCFVGMVAFSIPSLVKTEMKQDKFKIIPFLIGCAVIFGISYFTPEKTETVLSLNDFPSINLFYLIMMVGIGMIAGGAMFVPGVSGSMILLIMGQYYLFKSLLANVTSFSLVVLIPLFFMGIGILLGIVLSSKITGYCLKKFHQGTMNVILGLVVASSVVLIPFDATYNLGLIASCALSLLIGGVIVLLLEKLA
ncbi:MAG: DUF368 domain-containing protein [Erysipelotrichia bacterium]|nr:DUF368 domain-containing protein [Erysipelotrichia bacterium]NCC54441.1 DUF368 domain-containing protein [Erysipelotrichia bacterium]